MEEMKKISVNLPEDLYDFVENYGPKWKDFSTKLREIITDYMGSYPK